MRADEWGCGDVEQAYMEGSSWEATVVDDIVYLGGEDSGADETLRNAFSTHFTFGCQRKETGASLRLCVV